MACASSIDGLEMMGRGKECGWFGGGDLVVPDFDPCLQPLHLVFSTDERYGPY